MISFQNCGAGSFSSFAGPSEDILKDEEARQSSSMPVEVEIPLDVNEQVGSLKLISVKVEDIKENSALIVWSLNAKVSGFVKYGNSPSNLNSTTTKEESFIYAKHGQRINGLEPGDTVYFKTWSQDFDGNINESPVSFFQTLSVNEDINSPSILFEDYEDIQYGGYFLGDPNGGTLIGNTSIAQFSSRRFKAERSGTIDQVQYYNRVLTPGDLDRRPGAFAAAKAAGLDEYTAGYTFGNSYSVGNGGLITISVEEDVNGKPSGVPLGKTEPYVPLDHADRDLKGFNLLNEVSLEAGRVYHLVWSNSNMPNTRLTNMSIEEAKNAPRNKGAISLDGPTYNDVYNSGLSADVKGPWQRDIDMTLVKSSSGSSWRETNGACFYGVRYTDGVVTGDLSSRRGGYGGVGADFKAEVAGSTMARQIFKITDKTWNVDRITVLLGKGPGANGDPVLATIKNQMGQVLATAKIYARPEIITAEAKANTARLQLHSQAILSTSVELVLGRTYSIEFKGSSSGKNEMARSLPMKYSESRNDWTDAIAEVSNDGGATWGYYPSWYKSWLSFAFIPVGKPYIRP